ncbi:MAG TPA: lamin tail domain-containing protein, partial [Polyangia bacterium]|nr:lamin tail domain-containing protein [Polyangia bacterium]
MTVCRRPLGILFVLSTLAAVAAGACVRQPGPVADDAGMVVANLQLSPTAVLNSASFSITGPNAFARAGSIDVSHSQTISLTVSGIPAGSGYNLAITATATDAQTTCGGTAMFSITAGMTTALMIKIQCHEPPRTGNVTITGTVNVCPVVDAIGANPGEVIVGFTSALTASAHDSDARPAALAYSWVATSGMLAGATTPNPTLLCTTPGTSMVTLTVSDGDCTDTGKVAIVCSPAPAAPAIVKINEVESNGGTPGDWVELTNVGGTTADLTGWGFRDNDPTHAIAIIPAGTMLPPGGFVVLNEIINGAGEFGFGLGAADSANLYDSSGTVVDTFSWTAHA